MGCSCLIRLALRKSCRPVVTVREFTASATCDASLIGRVRPGADVQPRTNEPVESGVPFSFFLFLVFMLCAVISPFVGTGIVLSLCVKRWRYNGGQAGKAGSIAAAMFVAVYFALHALLGEDIPIQPTSVAVAGGAGFTVGVLSAWTWIWMRGRKGLTTTQ